MWLSSSLQVKACQHWNDSRLLSLSLLNSELLAILKNSDSRKKDRNHPKIWTRWFKHTVRCPKDADRIAYSSLIWLYTVFAQT